MGSKCEIRSRPNRARQRVVIFFSDHNVLGSEPSEGFTRRRVFFIPHALLGVVNRCSLFLEANRTSSGAFGRSSFEHFSEKLLRGKKRIYETTVFGEIFLFYSRELEISVEYSLYWLDDKTRGAIFKLFFGLTIRRYF